MLLVTKWGSALHFFQLWKQAICAVGADFAILFEFLCDILLPGGCVSPLVDMLMSAMPEHQANYRVGHS